MSVTNGAVDDLRTRSRRLIRSGPVPWMLPAIVVLGLFYPIQCSMCCACRSPMRR